MITFKQLSSTLPEVVGQCRPHSPAQVAWKGNQGQDKPLQLTGPLRIGFRKGGGDGLIIDHMHDTHQWLKLLWSTPNNFHTVKQYNFELS